VPRGFYGRREAIFLEKTRKLFVNSFSPTIVVSPSDSYARLSTV